MDHQRRCDLRIYYDADADAGVVSIVACGRKVGNRLMIRGKEWVW